MGDFHSIFQTFYSEQEKNLISENFFFKERNEICIV